jgi:membrane protease YdiL (CAAX protease family)
MLGGNAHYITHYISYVMTTLVRTGYRKYLYPFSQWITAMLLVCIAVQIVTLAMCMPSFYNAYIEPHLIQHSSLATLIYYLIFSTVFNFFCFFALPFLIGSTVFNLQMADMGLKSPKINKQNIIIICVSLFLLIILGYILSRQPSVRIFYSRGLLPLDLLAFSLLNLIALPIFYFAEEFFFRGMLFLTLWRLIGWHSYWVADIIFTLAHTYKPLPEMALSLVAGIILTYMTYKTKSIYPALLSHGSLGVMLNVLIYFNI